MSNFPFDFSKTPISKVSASFDGHNQQGAPRSLVVETLTADVVDVRSHDLDQTVNSFNEFKVRGFSLAKGIGIGQYFASDTGGSSRRGSVVIAEWVGGGGF